MGTDEEWEMATNALRGALESLGLDYVVNEGDGAFYGPKIDFHLEDSIEGHGSAEPSNLTSRCPRDLTWSTRERMEKSTAPS